MSKPMMTAVKSVVGQKLTLHEIEKPSPGPGQVLIRVRAAGVNRPDLVQRAGKYPPPPGAPDTLGLEIAGDIEAVGPGVTRWKGGEKVCALVPGGGYAEYALAHEGSTMPIPEPLSYVEAAGLPETVLTVWNNVFEMGKLKPGEARRAQAFADRKDQHSPPWIATILPFPAGAVSAGEKIPH